MAICYEHVTKLENVACLRRCGFRILEVGEALGVAMSLDLEFLGELSCEDSVASLFARLSLSFYTEMVRRSIWILRGWPCSILQILGVQLTRRLACFAFGKTTGAMAVCIGGKMS